MELIVDNSDKAMPVSDPKKKLGEQIIDNLIKTENEKQGIRETTLAMGDKYMNELKDLIEKHKHVKEPYYIHVFYKREQLLENAVKVIFVARRSRPTPMYDSTLYSMNNATGDLELLWTLPHKSEAEQVVKRWDIMDKSLVQWCYLMQQGKLV